MSDFNIFFPLSKVVEQDDGSVLVYSRATQSIKDASGECMDYDTTVPEIRKWSTDTFNRSNGASWGNIRSMHSNIAAGKVNEPIAYSDAEQAVDMVVKVIDPVEVKKTKEGVYTGLSMGGRYKKRWADPKNPGCMRYTGEPREFSLVDAPAVPTATFRMVKLDNSEELVKFKPVLGDEPRKDDKEEGFNDPERAEESPEPDVSTLPYPVVLSPDNVTGEMSPVGDKPQPPDPLVNGIEVLTIEGQTSPTVDTPKAASPDVKKIAEVMTQIADKLDRLQKTADDRESYLKTIGTRIGIARKDGAPLTAAKGYSANSSDYGDPANWAWPYSNKAEVSLSLSSFNAGLSKSKYSDREWNILGRRITAHASSLLGAKHQYNPQSKKIANTEVKKMTDQLQKNALSSVVADLRSAAQSALDNISDPDAVMNALHQILAGIDVATDIDSPTTSTPSSSGISSFAAGMPAGGTPTTGTTTATTAHTAVPTHTTPETKTMMDKIAATDARLDKLTGLVEKLVERAQPTVVQKGANLPADNLAALVRVETTAEQTPLSKAISTAAANYTEGISPDLVGNIMKESGGNLALAQNRAIEMVRESLAKRGFTSASRMRLIDPATVQAIRGMQQQ